MTDKPFIRVFMVEDDPDWIKSVTAFLNHEPDLLVVGAAASEEEALRLAEGLDYDVVLMDIQLTPSGREGIYAAMRIHELRPVPIIMLSSLTDSDAIMQSFTAGAANYLDKTRFVELPQTIRHAYRQTSAMEPLLREFARLKREEQLQALTPAEREVYELIEQGYTQSQIEQKLYKAESTLKNQVNKILKKLGVKSSKEAVEQVRRRGLRRQPPD
ncbi:DNA-binding response regulator [Paenibacillus sp. 598K]|uniref:response regulator n=1 Tax=Paenibacillus sp. 598K TaxID=1117987 RepID=UPI000FFA7415|nr:response regulator transcription factor [Paenibacillus sp. 598K]GBF74482.1 DNA-binding response regulator [Paenibacillus sp. 598K]